MGIIARSALNEYSTRTHLNAASAIKSWVHLSARSRITAYSALCASNPMPGRSESFEPAVLDLRSVGKTCENAEFQSANTSLSPASSARKCDGFSRPIRSVRNVLSTVINCETLTTESFLSPVLEAAMRTFPGASTRRRFEVTTATIAV